MPTDQHQRLSLCFDKLMGDVSRSLKSREHKNSPSWTNIETGSKIGKPNGHASRHRSRYVSSRVVSVKGSKPELIMSVQDINIQSQSLINVRDSNKVSF
ncbi:hypothetical protein HanPSC8_Chr10g0415271 [Helianthus annuus]|nr:hypothetical protein HanPSC8_Chr10g0415271 [Helianthus annuus]